MSEIANLLDKMRQTSQAATPGTWLRSGHGYQILTGDSWSTICRFDGVDGQGRHKDYRRAATEEGFGPRDETSNSAHIATCSPANVTQVLDHIESLKAEIAALRTALAPLARMDAPVGDGHAFDAWPDDRVVFDIGSDRKITAGDLRRARKAVAA